MRAKKQSVVLILYSHHSHMLKRGEFRIIKKYITVGNYCNEAKSKKKHCPIPDIHTQKKVNGEKRLATITLILEGNTVLQWLFFIFI